MLLFRTQISHGQASAGVGWDLDTIEGTTTRKTHIHMLDCTYSVNRLIMNNSQTVILSKCCKPNHTSDRKQLEREAIITKKSGPKNRREKIPDPQLSGSGFPLLGRPKIYIGLSVADFKQLNSTYELTKKKALCICRDRKFEHSCLFINRKDSQQQGLQSLIFVNSDIIQPQVQVKQLLFCLFSKFEINLRCFSELKNYLVHVVLSQVIKRTYV